MQTYYTRVSSCLSIRRCRHTRRGLSQISPGPRRQSRCPRSPRSKKRLVNAGLPLSLTQAPPDPQQMRSRNPECQKVVRPQWRGCRGLYACFARTKKHRAVCHPLGARHTLISSENVITVSASLSAIKKKQYCINSPGQIESGWQ